MNSTFETGGDGATATTHDWLTPPEILQALGPFDLDPCASQFQPWPTAARMLTIEDDGLSVQWRGRVWCNPPYGPHAEKFLKRCAEHGNAIALIFARTETRAFQEWCWRKADGMLFVAGRLRFRLPGGGYSRSCWRSVCAGRLWGAERAAVGLLWRARPLRAARQALRLCCAAVAGIGGRMNAFDTSGPSITAPTKAERAYTRKGLERTAQVAHMSAPRVSRFSTPIVSKAAQDRTNRIRGRV